MELQKKMFDYETLEIETREFVKAKELSIKARTSQTIWENGRDLLEVKERLEHGQFQKWVEGNFPWSLPTAERMIQVAERFENRQIDDFSKSVLYLLAAPSTPESARQEAIEKAEAGESITHKQAKELVDAHKAIEEKQARIGTLESRIKTLQVKSKGVVPGKTFNNADNSSELLVFKFEDLPDDFIVASNWERGVVGIAAEGYLEPPMYACR